MTAARAPGLHVDELRAHGDALLQGRDEVLLCLDRLPQLGAFCCLLRALGVEGGDIRRQLPEVGGENTSFSLAQRRRYAAPPIDWLGRIETMRPRAYERGLAAQDLRPHGLKLGARAVSVGEGRRTIELDQHVARLDERAVAHANVLDPAGFQGLDDLHLPATLRRWDQQLASRTGALVIASTAGAVPEPATWALMLLGFAGLSYGGLRQNRTRAASA